MPREIDRKLALTAAFLGLRTRKELAAAFRRADAGTVFDIDRAHKWLQGRSQPRDLRVYEEWARLLELDRPATWLADCTAAALLALLAGRGGPASEIIVARAAAFAGTAVGERAEGEPRLGPAGCYVCYSHAWSPYFRGRLIRAALTIAPASGRPGLDGTYAETLPTGRLVARGEVTPTPRALLMDLRDPAGAARFQFCLFQPTPPVSVLGGLMLGATIIGPQPEPSVTRIVMIRLAQPGPALEAAEGYLPPDASPAADLRALGLPVREPGLVDATIARFLGGGAGGGLDQLSATAYRELVEILDQEWLTRPRPAA